MRFGTHRRLWMAYRTFVSLNRDMISPVSAQRYEAHCLRAQLLEETSLGVHESVYRHAQGVRGNQEHLDGSHRRTEDFRWPSHTLGSVTSLNRPNCEVAHPVVTWPASQSVNCVTHDVDWGGSVPGAFVVRKVLDQAGEEWKPLVPPMSAAGFGLCLAKSCLSNLKIVRPLSLGWQTGKNEGSADLFLQSLDRLPLSADYSVDMPGLEGAGVPMEVSSVKRKRKKKMNKHKQRKLRRRDRHRK